MPFQLLDPAAVVRARLQQAMAPMAAFSPQRSILPRPEPEPALLPPPELIPEEDDSILSALGSGIVSGVGYVGGLLDKYLGGRAVRGLVGGLTGSPEGFRELLSPLPFSDAIGLTDPAESISGRDILENVGVVGPNQEGIDFGDVGGFIADVALDPSTWFTGGASALGKGGKVAAKIGALPASRLGRMTTTLDDVLRQSPHLMPAAQDAAAKLGIDLAQVGGEKLGSLARWRVPFTKMGGELGTGAAAQATASALDKAYPSLAYDWGLLPFKPVAAGASLAGYGDFVEKTLGALPGKLAGNPVSAATSRLFDPLSRGAGSVAGQAAARTAAENIAEILPEAKTQYAQDYLGLDKTGLLDTPEGRDAMRGIYERTWTGADPALATRGDNLRQAIDANLAELSAKTGQTTPAGLADKLEQIVGQHDTMQATARQELLNNGFEIQDLTDPTINYGAPRQFTMGDDPAKLPGSGGHTFRTLTPNDFSRRPELKGLPPTPNAPGGTASLNALASDTDLHGWLRQLPDVDMLEEASERQLHLLDAAGFTDVDGLTKWQAREILDQIRRGQQPTRHIWPPNLDPKITEDITDYVQVRYLGATADDLDQMKLLAKRARRGGAPHDVPFDEITDEIRDQFGVHIPGGGDDITDPAEFWEALRQHAPGDELDAVFSGMGPALSEADDAALAAFRDQRKQARWLAGWARKIGEGRPFDRDMLTEHMTGTLWDLQKAQYGGQLHNLFSKTAEFGDALPDGVPLGDALRQANMGGPGGILKAGRLLRAAGKIDANTLDQIVQGQADDGLLLLNQFRVPADVADDAKRVIGFFDAPEELSAPMQLWDALTNITKANLTSPFFSFANRNLENMFWQGAVIGAKVPGMGWRGWVQPWIDSQAMLNGETIVGAARRYFPTEAIDDVEATNRLRIASFAHRVSPAGMNEASDVVGAADLTRATLPGEIAADMPGVRPLKSYWAHAKSLGKAWGSQLNPRNWFERAPAGSKIPFRVPEASNPFAVQGGFGGREKDAFRLVAEGKKFNTFNESWGRNAHFLGLKANGYTDELAAAKMLAANVDYAHLSPFERRVMKRLIPFYTYTRRIIPFVMKDLMENPGGLTRQAMRTTNIARDDQGFIPAQIAGKSAIPLTGEDESGLRSFLTPDLPHDVLNDVFGVGATPFETLKQTGTGLLSMTTPVFKGAAELVTGQSFFQRGRNLADLHSRIGSDSPIVNQIVSNSPLSRYVTTASQLVDPRKGLLSRGFNFATGLRISDVNVEKAKAKAIRDALEANLRGVGGVRSYEGLYVKPEDRSQLSDDEQKMYSLYQQMRKRKAG